MIAKIEHRIDKKQNSLWHESMAYSVRLWPKAVSASCLIVGSIQAVIMQCLFLITFLLILSPNLSSAALPTIEALPPITSHLRLPYGVAVGDDEKIYVAESSMNQLHVFSKAGQYQGSINGLVGLASVAVDAIGRIYVGNIRDNGKSNVEVYGADLSLIGMLGMGEGEFRSPIGIAVDSAGLIYVVDGRDSEVKIYNADRSFRSSFGSKGSGNGQFQLPTSIAINEVTSEILIPDFTALTDSARVQVFDFNGVFLRSFITTGVDELGETVAFIRPFGIAVDTLDRIYITDSYQNVVTVYDTYGNHLGKLYDSNRPLRNPLGIAFAPASSRLFVASLNTGSVETFGIDNAYGSIAVSPQLYDFGSITVGHVSTTQRFDIVNNGSGNLTVGTVRLAGADASEFSIISNNCVDKILVSTAGCSIDVRFQPLTAGSKSAFLSILSDDIYASTLDIALNGNAEPPQYKLTVSKDGAGSGVVQAIGINCGTTCTNDYVEGTVVSLSVLPNGDSAFAGWSGGGCTGTASCIVTMSQAATVTATFDISLVAPVAYSVTASAGDNGTISPIGTVTAVKGSTISFSVKADVGSRIVDVFVDGVSVGAIDSYSFTSLGADHTITAKFSATQNLLLSSIEMGEVSVGDEWERVDLNATFVDPIVVVKPASLNDASPAIVRVRNVDAQGFDVRIQEWEYLADKGDTASHAKEQISYIVIERGSYILENGTRVEAGRFDTDASSAFATASFTPAFAVPPIVMSSVVTYNNAVPVISRVGNIGITGFGYKLQEEETNTEPHGVETVSFIAWEPSQGTQNGISFEVGAVADVRSQQTKAIGFSGSYINRPLFIADLQTTNGGAVNLRWSNKSATEINVLLDQEQSLSVLTSINTQQPPVLAPPSIEELGYLLLWSADLRPHRLTVEKMGLGSGQVQALGINCGTDCSEDYRDGAVVTLSATAAEGSAFVGWSGGNCRGIKSCTIALNQAITVTALFNKVHQLTIVKEGLGSGQIEAQGVNCGIDCSEIYKEGTTITLSAVENRGSLFAGWSGGGCSGTDSCVVIMNQATVVTALFNLAPDDDGDGLPDSYERQYAFLNLQDATDADADQDGDGVTNLQEYQMGSDPTKEDTDRDGLSDKYEFDNNLDPTDGRCPSWVCGGLGSWRHAVRRLKGRR